eukprot:355172-Chlamydomonas_euryale.AAC.5
MLFSLLLLQRAQLGFRTTGYRTGSTTMPGCRPHTGKYCSTNRPTRQACCPVRSSGRRQWYF